MLLNDKPGLIHILEKLEIYINNIEVLEYMSPEQQLDLKMQYWVIKEIYNSPHKALLSKLNRNNFLFRFLKVKRYKDYTDLEDFTAYFIKCLQNYLEEEV